MFSTTRYIMLAIEGDYIVGFDVYKHKDAPKMYNCRWNPDVKKWKVPDNIDKLKFYIDRVNTNEKESIKECWEQALKDCGHERVAKGTEQYLQVKTEMKRLLAEKNV